MLLELLNLRFLMLKLLMVKFVVLKLLMVKFLVLRLPMVTLQRTIDLPKRKNFHRGRDPETQWAKDNGLTPTPG